jgi:hypothetical protein
VCGRNSCHVDVETLGVRSGVSEKGKIALNSLLGHIAIAMGVPKLTKPLVFFDARIHTSRTEL